MDEGLSACERGLADRLRTGERGAAMKAAAIRDRGPLWLSW